MTKPKVSTPEDGARAPEQAVVRPAVVDVVAAISRRADGTPDQSPGFITLIPTDGDST